MTYSTYAKLPVPDSASTGSAYTKTSNYPFTVVTSWLHVPAISEISRGCTSYSVPAEIAATTDWL